MFALTVGTVAALIVSVCLAIKSKVSDDYALKTGFPLIIQSFLMFTLSTFLVGIMFPVTKQGVLLDKQTRSQLLSSSDVALVKVDGDEKPQKFTLDGGATLGLKPGDKVVLNGSQFFPGFFVFDSIQKP